jgi:hypothetical protein
MIAGHRIRFSSKYLHEIIVYRKGNKIFIFYGLTWETEMGREGLECVCQYFSGYILEKIFSTHCHRKNMYMNYTGAKN